ncbi:MAG: TetR family transcriptional regulator [Lachnospiraceae bacterium]
MEDPRIQRTKQLLFDAFEELLAVQDFGSISVNALCNHAMVRRATFYRHFQDRYDFFSAYAFHLRDQFLCLHQKEDAGEAAASMDVSYFGLLTERLLDFLETKQALVSHIVGSSAFPTLTKILGDMICSDTLGWIHAHRPDNGVSDEDNAAFFSGGILHLLLQCSETPRTGLEKKQMAETVCRMAALLFDAPAQNGQEKGARDSSCAPGP